MQVNQTATQLALAAFSEAESGLQAMQGLAHNQISRTQAEQIRDKFFNAGRKMQTLVSLIAQQPQPVVGEVEEK